MSIVRIQLLTVNLTPTVRPKECSHCGSEILQRWGVVHKPLRDTDVEGVLAYRYRCTQCLRTFRWYPEGVDGADLSQRLRCLAALAWSMGEYGVEHGGVGVIPQVRGLVEELPPEGDRRLMELWQMVQRECGWRKRRERDTPLQKLARLPVQLMENWRR